jgi:hypothetical protein
MNCTSWINKEVEENQNTLVVVGLYTNEEFLVFPPISKKSIK